MSANHGPGTQGMEGPNQPSLLDLPGKARELFESTSRLARVGAWEVDVPAARVSFCPMTCEIHDVPCGFSPSLEQAIGFYPEGENRDKVRQAIECAVRTGEGFDIEAQLDTAKGNRIWVRALGFPVFANGECIRLSGAVQDITRQKSVEAELRDARMAAEAATRAKSAFLATMSHEIRTPLNAVIGMASLLREAELEEPLHEYAQTIVRSSETLLELINDILDYSKIESRKLELHCAPFVLEDAFLEPVELFAHPAEDKGLELVHFFDPNLPRVCSGDELRIKQVLMNLLSNAIKFTFAGQITIEARKSGFSEEFVEVEFRIRDTGIGIAPDLRETIFQPFAQGDSSVTRHYGGSGLGLAISRELVRLMGGELELDSQPGKGSEFCFRLPMPPAELPPAPRVDLQCLRGRRLLVVDDVAVNRMLVQAFCHQWEMDHVGVDRAAAAMQMLASGQCFDVLVLDYQMPQQDGISLARELDRNPRFAPVPRILLSSITDLPEPLPDGLFAAVLHKPLRPSRLRDTLAGLFRNTAPPDAGSSAKPPELQRVRVLVAEDNPNNRGVLRLMLNKAGCQFRLVENGQQAVQAARAETFDVLLLDVQMPVLDGLSAARQLRREFAGQLRKPWLVALTANALDEDRRECLAAGFDHYLAKPVTFAQLREALVQGARAVGRLV